MKDHLEKYLELNRQFPNKAGKLLQVITTQKRLLQNLSRKRGIDDDTKNLLISVAEGYDVSEDLLEWMKSTLQEFANDAGTLIEGAKMRNIMDLQSETIKAYMDKETSLIEILQQRIKMYNEKIIPQRTSTAAA